MSDHLTFQVIAIFGNKPQSDEAESWFCDSKM